MRTAHRSHGRRLVGALAATGLVMSLTANPAAAAVISFTDPANDGSNGTGSGGPNKWGDIGKVRVKHGPDKLRVTIRLAEDGEHPDFYDVWVDTDADDTGPEFLMGVSMETFPGAGVARAESFGDLDGETTCSAKSAVKTARTMKITFHRRCFDHPAEVRVSAQTSMEYENADWAPKRKTFGPWVKTG